MIATTIVPPAWVAATLAKAARTRLVTHDRAWRTRNGPSQETGRTWFVSRSRRHSSNAPKHSRGITVAGYDAVQAASALTWQESAGAEIALATFDHQFGEAAPELA